MIFPPKNDDFIRKRFIVCNFGHKNLCQQFWETTQNHDVVVANSNPTPFVNYWN